MMRMNPNPKPQLDQRRGCLVRVLLKQPQSPRECGDRIPAVVPGAAASSA